MGGTLNGGVLSITPFNTSHKTETLLLKGMWGICSTYNTYMHQRIWMEVPLFVQACLWKPGQPQAFFSQEPPIFTCTCAAEAASGSVPLRMSLRQPFSLKLKFTNLARLADQQAPSMYLILLLKCSDYRYCLASLLGMWTSALMFVWWALIYIMCMQCPEARIGCGPAWNYGYGQLLAPCGCWETNLLGSSARVSQCSWLLSFLSSPHHPSLLMLVTRICSLLIRLGWLTTLSQSSSYTLYYCDYKNPQRLAFLQNFRSPITGVNSC